ncbi:MAG: efflux RND transporter permease subunit, partial [Acidimicrobiia bacterium]|nr:efflux RND transporter permease subunit [Acidimicrobiia bacterium]
GVWAVFLVVGMVAFMFTSPALRPSLQERDVLVRLEAAPGTSLPRMDEITAQVVDDLGANEGVTSIGAHVGRAILSDQLVNVNEAEIWLTIDPSADYQETLRDIEVIAAESGEVASIVSTYSERRVTEILGEGDDDLVVRVYGENPDVRQNMAEQIETAMDGTEGLAGVRVEAAIEEPAIEIEVDIERAQAFGVKPGDVRRQAATLLSGLIVGNLFEDQKVFDVVVWGTSEIRDSVDDVAALPISTPSGDQVPLGDLADVRIAMNPTVIRHESVATYLDVTASVSGRSMAAAAAEVDEAIKGMQFPLEHHAEVLGGFADDSAARTRVVLAAVAATILVYLLLQAAFSSWRLATLAFLALPMAVSGSVIAVALTGGDYELGSVAGTLALFSIAVRWVILMIQRYQRRERLGEAFGQDLVVTATANVVVPVVGSAIALAALFIPLVLLGGRAGLEIAAPAAVAVLGGMVTALILTLVVLPPLYLRWGRVSHRDTSADDLFTIEGGVNGDVIDLTPSQTTIMASNNDSDQANELLRPRASEAEA